MYGATVGTRHNRAQSPTTGRARNGRRLARPRSLAFAPNARRASPRPGSAQFAIMPGRRERRGSGAAFDIMPAAGFCRMWDYVKSAFCKIAMHRRAIGRSAGERAPARL